MGALTSCSRRTCATYAKNIFELHPTEYWAKDINTVDQGKLTIRIKDWTKDVNCGTFPERCIQQKSTIRSQKRWKGLTKGA